MGGDEDVVEILARVGAHRGVGVIDELRKAGEHANAGIHQLGADRDGHERADHAADDGEGQIERADVLVVRGEEKAAQASRMVMRSGSRTRHRFFLDAYVVLRLDQRAGSLEARRVGNSAAANFFFASASHSSYFSRLTTRIAIGMKA
jgi:hypothetical protein